MQLDSYSFSDIGGRSENQDAVGSREERDAALYVVADGRGGHQAGRLAADCVVETLTGLWTPDAPAEEETLGGWVGKANDNVLAIQKEKNCVTKSTVVALMIRDEEAVWAHTGDSRLYYIHKGKLETYTDDHSVAYKKYKAGFIKREDIPMDEDQSCLLRAIGGTTRFEPDTAGVKRLAAGDGFLLCSDGMWEYLTDEEIAADQCRSSTARQWGELLLERVKQRLRPGNDNLSLITVMVGR